MSAFLPQYDPNRTDRAEELQNSQRCYQYNYTFVSPLAVRRTFRFTTSFHLAGSRRLPSTSLTSLANRAVVEVDEVTGEYHRVRRVSAADVVVG